MALHTDPLTHHVYRADRSAAPARLIRASRLDVERLRAAREDGWDVGPALEHEQRRLAALKTASRR